MLETAVSLVTEKAHRTGDKALTVFPFRTAATSEETAVLIPSLLSAPLPVCIQSMLTEAGMHGWFKRNRRKEEGEEGKEGKREGGKKLRRVGA